MLGKSRIGGELELDEDENGGKEDGDSLSLALANERGEMNKRGER